MDQIRFVINSFKVYKFYVVLNKSSSFEYYYYDSHITTAISSVYFSYAFRIYSSSLFYLPSLRITEWTKTVINIYVLVEYIYSAADAASYSN